MNRLTFGALIAGLAGLLFGFDTAVIAGTTQDIRVLFGLDAVGLGVVVSMALWGTLLGALTAGWPGDRFGSRDTLAWLGGIYLIGSIGSALAWDPVSLGAFRFVIGVAVGASSVLAPVYISELAPPDRRGRLVGLFQFNIVLGILVAYLSNYLVGGLDLGVSEWRWKLAVAVVPALIFLVLMYRAPQSARWLIARGRDTEADAVLRSLGSADPEGERADLAAAIAAERAAAGSRLSWREHRTPILLAISLGFFNQLSGINAILYYLTDIFAAAGFGQVSADLQSVAIGLTNLVFTLLGIALIDRVGRKTLLLIGSVGMAVALSGAAAIFLTGQGESLLLWALIGFIASFALSQGAVIWVYISEIFPTSVRARGQSLGSGAHWLMNALLSAAFPVVAEMSRGLPFVFFAVMMVVQFVVVALLFPETRGVTLEAMSQRLRKGP